MKKFIYQIIFLAIVCMSFTLNVYAIDPPSRVARLSYTTGIVSILPVGETEWLEPIMNRPLTIGDRLWTDKNARAELQLNSTKIRIAPETSIKVQNITDRTVQLKLEQGTLILHILKIKADQLYEIDTPNVSLVVHQPGNYRINVDFDTKSTTVSVRKGQGFIYSKDASYTIKAEKSCRFLGTYLDDYTCSNIATLDDFDHWSSTRDLPSKRSTSLQYVSDELIGYEDLDSYGTWREIPEYGYAWHPTDVSYDWVPYRHGQWAWIEPWGWTWIEDEPWGFAPFHYGRWVYFEGLWYWIPNHRTYTPIYAPALVVFVIDLFIGNSHIGWFPLGPGDIYIPPYDVGRNYFININVRNTTINNTYVGSVFDNPNQSIVYRNQRIANAVTAVPKNVFIESGKVDKTTVPVKNPIEKISVKPADIATKKESIANKVKPSSSKPNDAVMKTSVIEAPSLSSQKPRERNRNLEGVIETPKSVEKERRKVEKDTTAEQQAARQAEEHAAAEARKAEEQTARQAQERAAAEARKAEEQTARQAQERAAAEARKAEEQTARQVQERAAAEARKAAEQLARQAQERAAAEARKAAEQQARQAEERAAAEARKAEEQQARQAQERAAAEARKAAEQQARQAEERAAAEARKAAEQQARQAEERAAAEARKAAEQQARQAEERAAAEAHKAAEQQAAPERHKTDEQLNKEKKQ